MNQYSDKLEKIISEISFPQNENRYRISSDSFILIDNIKGIKRSRVLDMGSGTGILSVLYSKLNPSSKITSIEISEESVNIQKNIIEINNIKNVKILCCDFIYYSINNRSQFDLIISNPPFYNINEGKLPENTSKLTSKHQVCCSEIEIIESSARLLEEDGLLCMIYPFEKTDKFLNLTGDDDFILVERNDITTNNKNNVPRFSVLILKKKTGY